MTATGNAVWSSRFAFIMASVGFAVGLGNIWRFPYVTGENGGSAFVVIYLLCAVAIGIPCLMAELLVGRRVVAARLPPWPPLPTNRAGAIAGKSLAAWAWSLPIPLRLPTLLLWAGCSGIWAARCSQGLLILMRQSPKPLCGSAGGQPVDGDMDSDRQCDRGHDHLCRCDRRH